MPTYLEEFGYFADVLSIQGGQEALLGKRTAAEVAGEWATYLGDAQKKWLAVALSREDLGAPGQRAARGAPPRGLGRARALLLCRAGPDPDRAW